MDEDEGSEKPFEASPRKLEEARKRGEVPISQDLVTFGVYAAILTVAGIGGAWTLGKAAASLAPFIAMPEALADSISAANGEAVLAAFAWAFMPATAAWLVLPFVFALAVAFLQGALVFAPVKLRPKLSRVSPIANARQKYGAEGLFAFAKSALKLSIHGAVLVFVFSSRLEDILAMPAMPIDRILAMTWELCLLYLAASTGVMMIVASIDYLWQRSQFLKRQRMTLDEMRREAKETEGDPHTKQARRQKAFDIATNRMLAEVPTADVVVVNPEHFAVALRWARTRGTAPVCVAKGVDEIAARIRERAIEHGVPVYRDAPTARALFAAVNIGEEIHVEHYQAIAAAIRFADAIRLKSSGR